MSRSPPLSDSDTDPSAATKSKHASLPKDLLNLVSSIIPPLPGGGSATSLLTRSSSVSSLESNPKKRDSVTRADNVTVSFVGGKPQPRQGPLRLRRSSIFGGFKDNFVSVDNGEISFAENELDLKNRETYSLLDIREIKLSAPGSNTFMLRLMTNKASGSAVKTVNLKASSPAEALEWIDSIRHELRNQVLVCRENVRKLVEANRSERVEPFFQQCLRMLKIINDKDGDTFETATILDEYSEWCEVRGRSDEAATMKRQAKAIRRRLTVERSGSTDNSSSEPDGYPPLPPRKDSPPGLPGRVLTSEPQR